MIPSLGRWIVLLSLPGLSAALIWWTRPAVVLLSRYSTSLHNRTTSQQHNILLAAQALNGVILRPGEVFSFNRAVGPRTRMRGYLPAPAFMTAETVDSVGGGICQVSSSLYNAALSAGLTIVERHAHYTLVASVPPGLDATVWYGQADLRLQNPYPWPIQLQVDVSQERLIVGIAGKHAVPSASIQREQEWLDPQHLQVSVYQGSQRLSQDRYVVTHVNKKTTNLSGH